MKLRPIERSDIDQIRKWRNEQIEILRTPFYLTEPMQEKWFENVVSDRNSKYRFYACEAKVRIDSYELVGYCALEINWEGRQAEVGIVLGKENTGKKYGYEIFELLRQEAFERMNLDHLNFESYGSNELKMFWVKLIDKYNGQMVVIPKRKYARGKYWDSIYGVISR